VATHELTVAQFQKFRSDHKYDARFAPKRKCSVTAVSWYDAVAYCNWLSEQEGLQRCYEPNGKGEYAEGMKIPPDYLQRTGYRLPTEQEWAFMCRAGTTSTYGFGEPVKLLTKYAWWRGNAEFRVRRVGLKLPNALGVFDMHGNVYEWCHTLYQRDQSGMVVKNADRCVLRGGMFIFQPSLVRSATRYTNIPGTRAPTVSVRRELTP
jgi:eukaryotic-like serine/threonine-protein kinase